MVKYQYYMGGKKDSFPDVILKDKYERVHNFEVKTLIKKRPLMPPMMYMTEHLCAIIAPDPHRVCVGERLQ